MDSAHPESASDPLRAALDALPAALLVLDAAGRTLFANRAQRELAAKNGPDFGNGDGAGLPAQTRLADGRTFRSERTVADNGVTLVLSTAIPHPLASSHTLLATVMAHSPVILWCIDATGTVLLSEGKALAPQGYRPGELVGRSVFDIYADRPGFLDNIRRVLGGESLVVVNEVAGGVYERWLEPVRDGDRIIGVIGVSVDISDRVQAEQALAGYRAELEQRVAARTAELEASERRLRLVLESSPVGIAIVQREPRRYLFANQRLLDIFAARDLEQMNSVPLRETYVRPEELDDVNLEFTATGRVRGREVERTRFDGGRIWVQMDSVLSEYTGKRVAIVWHYDITARREAVDALRAAKEQAEEQAVELSAAGRALRAANSELEAFSYSVSHDLRQPLRAIDGFSEAALQEYGDVLGDTGRDYLQRVRRAARRMGDLITAMLQLSRLTRAPMHREPVRLDLLARDVVAELRAEDAARDVVFDLQAGLDTNADPRLVRILLTNLIGNAWKFTARTSRARVELRAISPGVFQLRDNGAGFDMGQAPKLFNAFQRLHDAREFDGLGIGLATVMRIIQRHEGAVWAEGAPGEGATFRFVLEPAYVREPGEAP